MSEIVRFIEDHKVLVICRGLYGSALLDVVAALHRGGIMMAEVTFDQADPDATEKTGRAIRLLCESFPEMRIGAGTVTTPDHVRAAARAGGEFCLSPHVDRAVIEATRAAGLASIPGALTPSEIIAAARAGADIVKVFPAGWLGLDYLRDVKGPINHVRLLAAAGVSEGNLADFLDAGYCAAGISGRLTDQKIIASGALEELTRRARALTDITVARRPTSR